MLAGVNEGGVGEVFFRKALTARDRAAEPAAPRRRRIYGFASYHRQRLLASFHRCAVQRG